MKFTEEILNDLEWKRFETLCSEFLKIMGFNAKETKFGPDGGVDIIVHKDNNKEPSGVVQCKAWHTITVGERHIRDLLGVMAKGNYRQGMFMTTGDYTKSAREFAKGTKITLVTGKMLLEKINDLDKSYLDNLLKVTLEGDYKTPTCPTCGTKMKIRITKKGKNEGNNFWGCSNYPRCRHKFFIRAHDTE